MSTSNILRGLVAQFPSAPTSHGVTFGKQKDRPKAGSNLTAAGAARGPIGAIDRMKIVCLISATRRKYQMRIALTVAVSATLLAALSGHAQANQTCISKATEALPRIAGLVIKKARARPVPAAILATWKGQTRPIIVDVDTVAAGDAQTYSYMCVITQGSAFVQRTMN
jgi:hypothetical protein